MTGTPKSPPPSGHRHVVGNHMVDGNGNNVSMACSGYNLNLSTAAATTSYSAASSAMASSVRRSSNSRGQLSKAPCLLSKIARALHHRTPTTRFR